MVAKRILAVHDFSCHGAASLGIATPILTASGYKVVALPSVILSSTTDIDQDPVALSTTEWMYKVVARWKEQQLAFDAVYTGWLGDHRQIFLLIDLCEKLRHEKTIIFIDPVLGDGGVLYPCQAELAKVMNKLVAQAHVITPNPTEAALLLRREPNDCGVKEDGTITTDRACELVSALAITYPKVLPILKSVVASDQIGVCVQFTPDNSFGMKKSSIKMLLEPRTSAASIGGTGDLFASLLIARWLQRNLNYQSSQQDKIAVIKSVVKTLSEIMRTIQGENMSDLPFRKLLRCT